MKKLKKIFVFISSAIFLYCLTTYFSKPFVKLPDKAAENAFVVLELFTSQGCSSCPAADEQLKMIDRIARQKKLPVFPLSFHVDYWDRLGWKDTYSEAVYTQRQYEYARAFSRRNVYTPQMIVNGTYEFVGSDPLACDRYITDELGKQREENFHLSGTYTMSNNLINIHYQADSRFDGFLNIAIVQMEGKVNIRRGENSGKKMNYSNIVRNFKQFNCNSKSRGQWIVKKPQDLTAENMRIFVYLQNMDDMQILAAARVTLL